MGRKKDIFHDNWYFFIILGNVSLFFYHRDFYFWTLSCFLFIILASGPSPPRSPRRQEHGHTTSRVPVVICSRSQEQRCSHRRKSSWRHEAVPATAVDVCAAAAAASCPGATPSAAAANPDVDNPSELPAAARGGNPDPDQIGTHL